MGKPKKYLIKSINFGEIDNSARIIIETYIQKHGKTGLSALIRRLVITSFSDNPEYDDLKIKQMLFERKELSKNIATTAEKRSQLDEKLQGLGINPDELI